MKLIKNKKKRKLFRNPIFLRISSILVSYFIRILSFTYRYEIEGSYPNSPTLFIFWHRNLLPLIYNRRNENIVVMISPSADGDFIATAVEKMGFISARGSSSKKGTKALREMMKYSKQHSLAITPDGPKGPIYELKEGALVLAYLTKLPVTTIAIQASREWVFNSWDKFRVPKPFAKVNISYGEPLNVTSKKDFEFYKSKLSKAMKE